MGRVAEEERTPQRREGGALLVLRFALVSMALVVSWLAGMRWAAWREHYASHFGFPGIGTLLLVTALGVVAGLALGSAVLLPRPPWRFAVGRAAATGIVPALLTAVVILSFTRTGLEALPSSAWVLLQPFGRDLLLVFPVLLGVALAAGFTASGPPRGKVSTVRQTG